ncbi:hypothetical protein ACLMJK_008713 [Lecanora helva]
MSFFFQLLSTLFLFQTTSVIAHPPQLQHHHPAKYQSSSNGTASPVRNHGKRGLSYNDATLTAPFSLEGQHSHVSWAYNYYSYPYTVGQDQSGYNKALDFVPQLWSTAPDLTSVWDSNVKASVADYRTEAVLAFNEPDLCGDGGSCMNLSAVVTGYQKWMNPLAGTLRLGSPAVTNGLGPSIGLNFLKKFLQQCPDCQVDFIAIHWYGDAANSSDFENHVRQAYRVGGRRPIWVTEFGTTSGTAAQTETFLKTTMKWMASSPMVERFAWFMDKPGNLINANGTGLSDLGRIYNSGV